MSLESTAPNIIAAWMGMLVGGVWGAILGLFFHRPDWLGGYGSFERRMLRLGHIACFALGLINLGFAFTVQAGYAPAELPPFCSEAFIVGLIAMPLFCVLTAWRKYYRHGFFVPVLSLSWGILAVIWGLLA